MFKTRPISWFLLVLVGSLAIAFIVHTSFLHYFGLPKNGNQIILSYLVNGVLAAAIYILLFVFRFILKNQIGFLFIAGSFLKFVCFFVLFYPAYNEDGELNGIEFAAFFVPYGISLILETIFMAKMLKELD